MANQLEKAIWDAMLDAHMNVLYWEHLGNSYANRDKSLKFVLAILSSGTVASWLIASGHGWIWRTLSALTAFIASIYPFLQWNERMKKITGLREKWIEIYHETESLWIEYKDNQPLKRNRERVLHNKFQQIQKGIARAQIDEGFLSKNKKLRNLCYNEVIEIIKLKTNWNPDHVSN